MTKHSDRIKSNDDQSGQAKWIVLAVIIIIIIILVYAISLGKVNLVSQEDEKTRRLRWINKRLKNLRYQARTKEELKKKLDKKVRQYFLITRIALVVLYLAANVTCLIWLTDWHSEIGDRLSLLLNYNEIALIVILITLFIRFETPSEFRDVIRLIHLSIARIVYRNHKGLGNDIENINNEIGILTKEKDGLLPQGETNEIREEK